MANCSEKTRQNSQNLINSPGIPWGKWPQKTEPGIYVIKQGRWVIYVGRTDNLKQRPRSHCYGKKQAIAKHIGRTAARRLSYNYVTDSDQRCNEHCYLHHITKLQGQKPRFNKKKGDACVPCPACVQRS